MAYWCNQCLLLPILDDILVDQYILSLFSDDILIGQYILLRLSIDILVEQYVLLRLSEYILFGQTYCCRRSKRIGRAIRIAALTRWHIPTDVANALVDQYVLLRLRDDILLPMGQTHWSTNTYCCAYAMTYCYRRGKRIGRPLRVAAFTRWHIVRCIRPYIMVIEIENGLYMT